MVRMVQLPDAQAQRSALIRFRKLLAHEDIHPYLDRIVEAGIVPTFVRFLHRFEEPEFQVCIFIPDYHGLMFRSSFFF